MYIYNGSHISLFLFQIDKDTVSHQKNIRRKTLLYVSVCQYGIAYNNVIAEDDELHRFGIDPVEYSRLGIGQEVDVYFQYDSEHLGIITNH